MLSPSDKDRLSRERNAFKEFWKGDRSKLFVVEHCESYCVCDVLSPSKLSQIWAGIQSLIVLFVFAFPFSSAKVALLRLLGAKIGRGVYISPGVVIDPLYPSLIELDDNVLLGLGCHLVAHEHTATHFRVGKVRVGEGSVVGGFSTVRCGVTIGRKITVGCNSFVNKDVPDGQVVGGVPAKPLERGQERVSA